jgi:hypothetical protein
MGSFTASDIQHFISHDGTYYAMIRYKNLIFLYNQRNIQYYPIILYYNNILQKYITGKSLLKIIQVYRDV